MNNKNKEKEIHQPTRAQDVDPEQKEAIREEVSKGNQVLNPGDKVSKEPESLEEKAQKVAVDAPDITGDHITVPTYFIVEDEEGEKEALHHVKDADEISDVIRQARVDEEGNRTWW